MHPRILTALSLILLGALGTAQAAPLAPQRAVYVLAGQSNTADLRNLVGSGCPSAGVTQPNVTYWEATSSTGTLGPWSRTQIPTASVVAAAHPMLTLGNRLGAAHPGQQVEVLMIAQGASALLWRNFVTTAGVNGACVDQAAPGNPFTWMRLMEPVMQSLALGGADEFHIVWGQGESDALPGQTTTTQEYIDWAQIVFAWLAAHAGKSEYTVHLVTLGALYTPLVNGADMERIRDALFRMPGSVLPLPGITATILPAAHHYDLGHRDPAHLTACESTVLAGRIADGILQPGALPLRVDAAPTLVGTTDIVIGTTAKLVAVPFGQASNKFFEVTRAGVVLSPSDFEISAAGFALTVRVPSGGLTPTNFSVRHVFGTGNGLDWETMPTFVDTVLGLPLEPFIAP